MPSPKSAETAALDFFPISTMVTGICVDCQCSVPIFANKIRLKTMVNGKLHFL